MRRSRLVSSLLLSSLVYVASPARATLVAVDLPGGPVDEVTLDDVTGLQWYDVSETVNVSFADAPGVAQAATGLVWRHATGAEVCALLSLYADASFGCAGSPLAGTSQVSGDVSAAFRALLGPTAPGASYVFGYYDDGDANPLVGSASTNSFVAGGQFTLTAVAPNAAAIDETNAVTGNWLVAVPEPATSIPLMLGLTSVAIRSRKRPTTTPNR
jgi:hypothetical protein